MNKEYQKTEEDATKEERADLREQLLGEKAQNALAFQTVAVRHFGADAGIFLRQLLYRDGSGKLEDFWIYKSYAEWEDETGLQRRGQERARKRLVGAGAIEEKRAVLHGRRTLHFRVDSRKVMEILGDGLPHAKPSTRSRECTVNRTGSLSTADNDLAYSRQGITEDYSEDSDLQSDAPKENLDDDIEERGPVGASSRTAQPTPQEGQRGEAVKDLWWRRLIALGCSPPPVRKEDEPKADYRQRGAEWMVKYEEWKEKRLASMSDSERRDDEQAGDDAREAEQMRRWRIDTGREAA